jgi:RNA-directed DNA polymerase
MGQRVQEAGESERRAVIARIGVEQGCNITPRESGPTSRWSLSTRELDQPTKEAMQMTATPLAGAAPHHPTDWHAINWPKVYQNVRRLQARIVQATKDGR